MKRPALLLLVIGATVIAAAMSMFFGTRPTTPVEVFTGLLDFRRHTDLGRVVWYERFPRTVLAIIVGAAMALAGGVVQGYTRNPLAEPGILGIASGAAFFGAFGTMIMGVQGQFVSAVLAMIGAAVAALLVFGAGTLGGGGGNAMSLVLAGAAVTAFFISATTAVILSSRESLNQYRFWSAGSLVGRGFDVIGPAAAFVVVGAVIALACGPALNALATGTDMATSLGVSIGLIRAGCFASVVLLAGAATAAAGPLVFIGLVVPHIIRGIIGPDYRWLLPLCIPLGAGLVLISDILARIVFRPSELPVGVVLAFVGVPFFIAMVRQRRLVAG